MEQLVGSATSSELIIVYVGHNEPTVTAVSIEMSVRCFVNCRRHFKS
jgi:hypothetical protein